MKLKYVLTVIGLTTVTTLALNGSAYGDSSGMGSGGEHCAVGAPMLRDGVEKRHAGVTGVRCFKTLGESLEYATGGRLNAAEVAGVKDIEELNAVIESSDSISTPQRQVMQPLLGIHWDYVDFEGRSRTIYGSNGTGCSGGVTYGVPNVGSSWNDDLESGYSYSSCLHRVYENQYYGGAQFTNAPFPGGDYGLLRNEVTSIVYY